MGKPRRPVRAPFCHRHCRRFVWVPGRSVYRCEKCVEEAKLFIVRPYRKVKP